MDIGSVIALIILIMFSAFFSGSEIAYASANKMRLKKASESGNKYAKVALYIYEHFDDALSTVLVGNNLVNIGAASISAVIAIGLMGESGAAVSTVIMTIIILIFGEISPKTIAKKHCDKFTLIVAYPLRFLMFILKPLIFVIGQIVKLVSKLWDNGAEKEPSVTEEELVSIIESVADDGLIDEDRSELLQSALEFSEITAQEILTPRTDMLVIDIEDDRDSIIETIVNSPYSRIPVYEGTIDNIIGILHIGSFMKELVSNKDADIRSSLIESFYVFQTMKLPKIFSELKNRYLQMAIVTDEYGGTMGLITLEDVLEELVGEIWDESDEVINDFVSAGQNKYLVSGYLSIYDFLEYVGIDDRSFDSYYTTVGGWVIENINGFPNINDEFEYKNLKVTVTKLDGLRVEQISVFVAPELIERP